MLSVNHVPCSGHSLGGTWGSEALVNSVVMKDSRTFPGGSQGNCPPSSETLVSAPAQGLMLSTSPRELPADGGDTPSLRLRAYR